jgi:hypothetical protein
MTTAINAVAICKLDKRTDGLTEAELSKVAAGTPSIPIPPPRPAFLAR